MSVTIQGLQFQVPDRYSVGHQLTADEASVLNQTFRENIRNNFASTVDKAKKEAETNGAELDTEDLQAQLDKYVAEYSFGIRRGGGGVRVTDPVEREARNIAKTRVLDALKKKNISLKSVPKEKLNSYIDQALEKHGDAIRERAQRVVADREQAMAEMDLNI